MADINNVRIVEMSQFCNSDPLRIKLSCRRTMPCRCSQPSSAPNDIVFKILGHCWNFRLMCAAINENRNKWKSAAHLSCKAMTSGSSGFAYHLHRGDPCNDNFPSQKSNVPLWGSVARRTKRSVFENILMCRCKLRLPSNWPHVRATKRKTTGPWVAMFM